MSNKVTFLVIAVMLVLTIGLAAGFFMMWGKLSEINTQGPPTANIDTNQSQMAQLGPLFPWTPLLSISPMRSAAVI